MAKSMKELFEKALPSRPSTGKFAFMCLCSAVCAALPGTNGASIFTGIAFIFASAALLAFSRTLPVLLPAGLFFAAVFVYTQNTFWAVCACSVTVAIGLFAYLAVTTRSPVIFLIIPASYALAVLAGGSLLSALTALVPFPAAFVLAYCIGKSRSCSGAVCATASALGCSVLLALAVYVFVSNGRFDLSLLKDAANGLYESLIRQYTEQFEEMLARYAALGYDISKLGISSAEIRETAATVFSVIPAVFALVVSTASYTAHKYSLTLIAASGRSKLVCKNSFRFDMSIVSVAVFFISCLVMTVASYSDGGATVAVIAENVFLTVLPGLALIGLAVLLGRNRKKKKYIIPAVVFGIMMLILPSVALAVMSFIGCSSIIRNTYAKAVAAGSGDKNS